MYWVTLMLVYLGYTTLQAQSFECENTINHGSVEMDRITTTDISDNYAVVGGSWINPTTGKVESRLKIGTNQFDDVFVNNIAGTGSRILSSHLKGDKLFIGGLVNNGAFIGISDHSLALFDISTGTPSLQHQSYLLNGSGGSTNLRSTLIDNSNKYLVSLNGLRPSVVLSSTYNGLGTSIGNGSYPSDGV